ncbi:GDSL-type esterase/lipase family protein [Umezawaea endophytica]|uniref:GDSL-type esterase/lipase family protein n=1 Tax=Umezawaea endophytica TaxID=1654476 RepID=A0A9X2VG12_9PSEU|nr:GDSL-type esterase/lipase family protein [Umezawaea endophytica]MCS7475901.1 GDSL-type esterase/lipase family protein [Umezawaea endophytica]
MVNRGVRPALVGALLVVLGACSAGPVDGPAPTSTTTSPPPVERVLVSLGDSYATGYRPTDAGVPAGPSEDGFAHLVADQADLELINVACSGATSAQLRDQTGCALRNRPVDGVDVTGSTQLDAAVRALRENAGRVGLVTVVIGGNDLAPCALSSDAVACATQAVAGIRANLASVLPALREAAGDAPIVGLTYPDVFLGAWVSSEFPNGQALARLSVPLFRDVLNTALAEEYGKVGASFVDVTAATGGYEPLTEVTQDPTYGPIPTPVAKVCALTYFCRHTDVHPTPAGHQEIATAVLAATGR